MKVLAIAPWVPSARRPRSFGLLQELATVHDVTLIAATWSDEDRADLDRLAVQRTRSVPLSRGRGALRAARGAIGTQSLQQAYLSDAALARAIAEEVSSERPDLTYFNVLRTAQFARLAPGPRLIDLDEFRSAYYEQLAGHSRSPAWRLLGRVEGARMRASEDAALGSFDTILVSSPSDLARDPARTRLVRSPHQMPAAPDRGARPAGDEARPRIVFVGRLSYRANVEAVRWFAAEVLPLVLADVPDAVFEVVGEAPHRSLRRLEGPAVRIVGPVPEVAPHYIGADVSVVPVFLATGVQMKLIESLSLGVATVTTSTVAGLAGIDGGGADEPCVVADDPADWARAVVALLRDPQRRASVGAAGARWAAGCYDRASIARSLHDAVRDAVDGGSRGSSVERPAPVVGGGRP